MEIDVKGRAQRLARWYILLTLNTARPVGCAEGLILACVNDGGVQLSPHELRQELDYLEARELIAITSRDSPVWVAKLTRTGIDVVEYTVPVEPGIARPAKGAL